MKRKPDINGIILAGGKSERMGTPKAFLEFQGKPFIWYCIEALKPLTKKIVVVSDDSRFEAFPITRISDEIKESGPVGGLYSGLNYSNTQFNLVLSCDVPCIQTSMLQRLVEAMDETIDVIQLAGPEKSHPLLALYQKRCTNYLKQQLENDERRLREVVAPLKTKTLIITGEEAKQLKNINTKKEYKELTHDIEH